MNPTMKTLLAAGVLGALAMPSLAQITYVDAQEGVSGNTFATGGSLADTSWIDLVTNTGSSNATKWVKRTGTGFETHNNLDVIQAATADGSNDVIPELTTQITGLSDGTYDVWVFFWDQITNATQDWIVSAGLTSGALTTYSNPVDAVAGTNTVDVVNANTLTFSNAPSVIGTGGLQNMFAVNLGQATVTGGSAINVYIDRNLGAGTGNRVFYDGVGYESVVTFDIADLDQDGDVDDADFGIAFAAFTGPDNGPSNNPAADLDGDDDVDDADFGIAFAHFTGPGGGAAVPEPTSLALLAFGGLAVARRRRQA